MMNPAVKGQNSMTPSMREKLLNRSHLSLSHRLSSTPLNWSETTQPTLSTLCGPSLDLPLSLLSQSLNGRMSSADRWSILTPSSPDLSLPTSRTKQHLPLGNSKLLSVLPIHPNLYKPMETGPLQGTLPQQPFNLSIPIGQQNLSSTPNTSFSFLGPFPCPGQVKLSTLTKQSVDTLEKSRISNSPLSDISGTLKPDTSRAKDSAGQPLPTSRKRKMSLVDPLNLAASGTAAHAAVGPLNVVTNMSASLAVPNIPSQNV